MSLSPELSLSPEPSLSPAPPVAPPDPVQDDDSSPAPSPPSSPIPPPPLEQGPDLDPLETVDEQKASSDCDREQVEDDGLPLGWIAIHDKSTDSLYYFHSTTQEVTWSRPELQRAVVEADLPYGWIAIKDSSSQAVYYFNQYTQEVTWEKPELGDFLPTPGVVEATINERPRIRPAALLAAKSALVETKSRDSSYLQGLSEADMTFLNEVLRPKYGDGQLLKDPALVDSLFAHMVSRESLRRVMFCEFFLSCFRQELILQAMLRKASWKVWLLTLISGSSTFGAETVMLDYVLMTLIEMFAYFFHRFSENENTILGTDVSLGIGVPSGKHVTMYDFIMDAALVIARETSKDVCLRVFSGTFSKIGSWGPLKPPWAVPDFLMPQWQNLFSSLEAVEECVFLMIPSKEFHMPEGPLFPGMGVVEAVISLLEKLKIKELDQVVETDPAILKLQRAYSSKGIQELDFFRGVRDFFQFYSNLGCMEKHKFGFETKAKPPARCSQAEFVHLLLSRKRVTYGTKSQLQKKVAAYVAKVGEIYSKVFAGQLQAAPHLVMGRNKSPTRASGGGGGEAVLRRSSTVGRPSANFIKQVVAGRKMSLDVQPRFSSSGP